MLAEEAVIYVMTVRDVVEAVIAVSVVNLDSPLETIVGIYLYVGKKSLLDRVRGIEKSSSMTILLIGR